MVNYPESPVRPLIRLPLIAVVAGGSLALGIVALAMPVNAVINHGASSTANALPDINAPQSQRSIVYAADGSVLAVLHAAENRSPVTIDKVPNTLINAVVDVEDARFFTHGGIDVKSTVRALARDTQKGALAQGGSTITQQLVKTLLNTPQKHLDRKIKEAVIANRIEKKYTKRQILQAYLNTVYFGNGAYGVEAAAETYFNEDVGQVTAPQAAFLAGVIRDPLGYDPILNPIASKARRNFALDRMATQNHLTQAQADALKATPLPTKLTPPQSTAGTTNDYFVEQVKQILLNQSTTLGNSYTERYNALFDGGLKIYTTLDPHLEALAQQTVTNGIPQQNTFTGSLASIDPTTGKVRAIVGGPGFDKAKYDLATQALRQPGSGFKVFTLLAAYEAGYGPNDTVLGTSPCAVDFPSDHDLISTRPGLGPIHNSEGDSAGALSVTAATAGSVNCAFIRIAHEVGLQKVIDMAHRLGLSENFTQVPSMVIGSQETTVLEMAGAYATLADDGVYHKPTFIDHILDRNGKTIYQASDPGKRVLDPQISRMAVQTLQQVVCCGTGTAALLPDRPVAGKTGTTEHNTDAWFNGITPQLVSSVWMGDPHGRTPMTYVGGITVFGGTYPARIWHAYTEAALQGQPPIGFPPPDPNKIPVAKFIMSPGLQKDDRSSGFSQCFQSGQFQSPFGQFGQCSTSTSRPSTRRTTPTSTPTSTPPSSTPPTFTPPTFTPPSIGPPTSGPATTPPKKP
jgi:penicillin-binding protein 1A